MCPSPYFSLILITIGLFPYLWICFCLAWAFICIVFLDSTYRWHHSVFVFIWLMSLKHDEFLGPFILLQMAEFHFSWARNILVCVCLCVIWHLLNPVFCIWSQLKSHFLKDIFSDHLPRRLVTYDFHVFSQCYLLISFSFLFKNTPLTCNYSLTLSWLKFCEDAYCVVFLICRALKQYLANNSVA